jgi:hypothetical protein
VTLFKEFINLKSEDYEAVKADQIIFSYHILSENFTDTKLREEDKNIFYQLKIPFLLINKLIIYISLILILLLNYH